MNDLLMSVLVLFSSSDGKLMETTARETAWYLERLASAPVRCVVDGQADREELVVALGKACDSLDSNSPLLGEHELQVIVRDSPDVTHSFSHTYTSEGEVTVMFEAQNCGMTEVMSDTVQVTVSAAMGRYYLPIIVMGY